MDIKPMGRREALGMLGAAGAAFTFGCAGNSVTSPSTTTTTTTIPGTSSACAVTPAETVGPFRQRFTDSLASELAAVSGDPTTGYTATFRLGIAV